MGVGGRVDGVIGLAVDYVSYFHLGLFCPPETNVTNK